MDEFAQSELYATRVDVELERSLSPDLVSLSSTSDSEGQSDEEPKAQHQTASRDNSNATRENDSPSNAALSADLSVPHPASAAAIAMDSNTSSEANGRHPQETNSTPPSTHHACSSLQSDRSEASHVQAVNTSLLQYQLFDKSKLTVSDFESRGLLYARANTKDDL